MGLFEQFPYSNFHELNIDWLLKTIKKLAADWLSMEENYNTFKTDVEKAIADLTKYVNDEISKITGDAIYPYISEVITDLYNDGYFDIIVRAQNLTPKPGTYTPVAWLADAVLNSVSGSGTYYTAQGCCAIADTDTLIYALTNGENNNVQLREIDYDGNIIRTVELPLYHCNWLSYNPVDNVIYASLYSSNDNSVLIPRCAIINYNTLSIVNYIDFSSVLPTDWVNDANANGIGLSSLHYDLISGKILAAFHWQRGSVNEGRSEYAFYENGTLRPITLAKNFKAYTQGAMLHNSIIYVVHFGHRAIFSFAETGDYIACSNIAERSDRGIYVREIEQISPITSAADTDFLLYSFRYPWAGAWVNNILISKINLIKDMATNLNTHNDFYNRNVTVNPTLGIKPVFKTNAIPAEANNAVSHLSLALEMVNINPTYSINITGGSSYNFGDVRIYNQNLRILGSAIYASLFVINSKIMLGEAKINGNSQLLNSDVFIRMKNPDNAITITLGGNSDFRPEIIEDLTNDVTITCSQSDMKSKLTIINTNNNRNTELLKIQGSYQQNKTTFLTSSPDRKAFKYSTNAMTHSLLAVSSGVYNAIVDLSLRGGAGSYDVIVDDTTKFRFLITQEDDTFKSIKVTLVRNDTEQSNYVRLYLH